MTTTEKNELSPELQAATDSLENLEQKIKDVDPDQKAMISKQLRQIISSIGQQQAFLRHHIGMVDSNLRHQLEVQRRLIDNLYNVLSIPLPDLNAPELRGAIVELVEQGSVSNEEFETYNMHAVIRQFADPIYGEFTFSLLDEEHNHREARQLDSFHPIVAQELANKLRAWAGADEANYNKLVAIKLSLIHNRPVNEDSVALVQPTEGDKVVAEAAKMEAANDDVVAEVTGESNE